jgi:amino acid transporter
MDRQEKPVSSWARLRRLLIGKPIPTSKAHHERLGPLIGLPVFSSDAMSSVAYATEAILAVLVLASSQALHLQFGITLAILALIIIIATSYNQTIHAYPNGGGSYIVASDNLGTMPGLVAGAALLIDYVLTVAVSVSAGVAAITSAFPHLHPYLVPISLFAVAVVAWANLRGLRESGALFAIPTYGFILSMIVMLSVALFKAYTAHNPAAQVLVASDLGKEAHVFFTFVLLRAFAAGCTALTGIEAVSDSVQAFRVPEAKNASLTLRWMVVILSTVFVLIGLVVPHLPKLQILSTADPHYRTLISQIAEFSFGPKTVGFYIVQFTTAAILVLAANTAFADFPRLASFVARDGFLPRALTRQGDRLVFHNGIILLSLLAGFLVFMFKGELDALLPLYAIGHGDALVAASGPGLEVFDHGQYRRCRRRVRGAVDHLDHEVHRRSLDRSRNGAAHRVGVLLDQSAVSEHYEAARGRGDGPCFAARTPFAPPRSPGPQRNSVRPRVRPEHERGVPGDPHHRERKARAGSPTRLGPARPRSSIGRAEFALSVPDWTDHGLRRRAPRRESKPDDHGDRRRSGSDQAIAQDAPRERRSDVEELAFLKEERSHRLGPVFPGLNC